MWGWSIFSQDFVSFFQLTMVWKKERCVTLCPKTFITSIASFFSAHEKLMCFGKECFVKA